MDALSLSPEEAFAKLRELREENVRDSELIVEIGEKLVRKYINSFGNEVYLMCEQVFLAALDITRYDLAYLCLEVLESNFPKSIRVRKLQGIQFEAEGKYEKALELYNKLEEEDPTNSAVKKRKIAIWKSKGKTSEAIHELTDYLKIFMTDQEAWGELADLYIEELEYDKAAYCLEELIIMNAFNHIYYQRYAEVKFTQGGSENLEMARQYFAQAIRLSNNKSIRALYGFLLTTTQLTKGKNSNKANINLKYATWSASMIKSKYRVVWEDGDNGDIGIAKSHITDVPQLTASVTQMIDQLRLSHTSS